MDYIADTLDMFPEPAALYDADLHLIAANASAWSWVLDLPDQETTREEWREHTGLGEALTTTRDEGVFGAHLQHGWVHGTRIKGGFQFGRPDLVLISLHREDNECVAKVMHSALLAAFQVNETAQQMIGTFETVILSARASLNSQQAMVENFNTLVSNALQSIAPKKDPAGS